MPFGLMPGSLVKYPVSDKAVHELLYSVPRSAPETAANHAPQRMVAVVEHIGCRQERSYGHYSSDKGCALLAESVRGLL